MIDKMALIYQAKLGDIKDKYRLAKDPAAIAAGKEEHQAVVKQAN